MNKKQLLRQAAESIFNKKHLYSCDALANVFFSRNDRFDMYREYSNTFDDGENGAHGYVAFWLDAQASELNLKQKRDLRTLLLLLMGEVTND